MRTTNMKLGKFGWRLARMAATAVFPLLVVGLSSAQQTAPKTFSSPGEACHALFQAVQNHDEQALEAILGAGNEVTSSSDQVEDNLARERFSQKYQEMHRLVHEPDGTVVLYIGAENWPFPVPLVTKNGRWSFDSDAGAEEILFRTVGENEITAIQVCHAFALAKKQGETKATGDDPISQYVQTLVIAATANGENTGRATQEKSPFHGYYAVPIAGRTASVSAGKKAGKSVLLIAFPAEYRSSGVMTFVVTQDGAVYEKDLGPDTAKLSADVKELSVDSSWHVAE